MITQKIGGTTQSYRSLSFLLFFLSLNFHPFAFAFAGNHFKHNFHIDQLKSTRISERYYNQSNSLASCDFLKFPGIALKEGIKNQDILIANDSLTAIKMKRPWWKNGFAIAIYTFLFIAAALGIRKYELSRIRLKNQMLLMHLEADKLKELDQLKSRFFANISHELRTPLTLIKGPVEQMMDHATGTEKTMLSVIRVNTNRLLNLINQLFDLSKLESGEYRIKVSRGDIINCIKEVVLSFDSLVKEKNINLRFVEGAAVQSLQVSNNFYFSKDAIENIIINLLHNALKFTPAGGNVTVTACLHKSKNGQEHFEITIKDAGSGIEKDKIPLIYNRYFQIDDSLSRHNEGAGIGLAYVKELVEAHKGHIAVMSKPHHGTTFRLRFPLGGHQYFSEQIDDHNHTNTIHHLLDVNHPPLTIPRSDCYSVYPFSKDAQGKRVA